MNTRRLLYSVMSAVMFLSGILLMFYFLWTNGYINVPKGMIPTEEITDITYPSLPSEIIPSTEATQGNGGNTETAETFGSEQEKKNPVDFEELHKTNADIIGWIHMTDPEISQPILMHQKDDDFYLSHNFVGKYSRDGSFYIEKSYNSPGFDDPVTIIYGHRRRSGHMFGDLQNTISKKDINNEPQYVVIYLPNSTKTYHIIATIRHDSTHILHYNDFSKESVFDEFFAKAYKQTGTGVQLIGAEKPKPGDKILILSTCLVGDRTKRFLVIAKELT
ncbi:MAG: class B sortase [Clostridiales bacterium]|nr:class B sortase [Clostridiales bacterium]